MKNRRFKNRNIKSLNSKFFLLAFSILLLIIIILLSGINADSFRKSYKIAFPFNAGRSVWIPADLFPKNTPTPTQVPLVGYCLHVPVLMYHHIQPELEAVAKGQTALTVDSGIFASQMAYLSQNGYTPIWANELAQALISHSPLSGKPIVITIDDGYKDNIIYALPVLQQYGIKANIMLATGLMGGSDMLSWDDVRTLKNSGLVYFTNHTWSHYAVSKGPQSKIEDEIDTGASQIQTETGQAVNMFTYPYGAFNPNAEATLAKKGYLGAFSEIPGQIQCDSFLMTLHRTRIGNGSLAAYGI